MAESGARRDPGAVAAPRPPGMTAASGSRGFLYPFLFSLYPVFFLYLRNIREVTVYQALWASAGSLGIAIAGWFLTRIFSEELEKRALVLFLFLLLFHFYGLYYALIAGWLLELSPRSPTPWPSACPAAPGSR